MRSAMRYPARFVHLLATAPLLCFFTGCSEDGGRSGLTTIGGWEVDTLADVDGSSSAGDDVDSSSSGSGSSSDGSSSSDSSSSSSSDSTDTGADCTGVGPAYVHGDIWPFWHNFRVACDPQHKWLWICEQREGPGNCPAEQQRFDDCWNAQGDFPPSTWDNSTPTPHSANYGVCQPQHWPEKNDPNLRPGNPVPCDTTTFDYDLLRTADPRYGVDWWTGSTGMRHLTLKVFAAGADPFSNNGQGDALAVLSTHPGSKESYTEGLSNHPYPGAGKLGCLPAITGEDEQPYPAQNFGAFYWLEVPTDQPVTLAASWIGFVGDAPASGCLLAPYIFPPSFAAHAEPGKPWYISSPCWDFIENVQLEPGRHYVWDLHGFRQLPGCSGPPSELVALASPGEQAALADGSCG